MMRTRVSGRLRLSMSAVAAPENAPPIIATSYFESILKETCASRRLKAIASEIARLLSLSRRRWRVVAGSVPPTTFPLRILLCRARSAAERYRPAACPPQQVRLALRKVDGAFNIESSRSEEHTSELQ